MALKGIVITVGIIAAFLALLALLVGGAQKMMNVGNGTDAKPVLEIVYYDLGYTVFRDTETNVMYAKAGREMTPMFNSDGTLKLYEGVDIE